MSSLWPLSGKLRDNLRIKKIDSRYSAAQISQWLKAIEFPTGFSEEAIASGSFATTLENLTLIHRLHLVKYPYENTAMHYTKSRDMDLTREGLFRRIVGEGKGSYCFGTNIFYIEALRGLGYRVYSGAARINESVDPTGEPEDYTPFSHMVLFVQPGNGIVTFLVDAAGGGSGPSRPILLSASPNNVVMGVSPTESHRLTRGSRSDCSFEFSPGVDWHLDVLHSGKDRKEPVWRTLYTFTEAEFFEKDYLAASFAVSKMTGGFFTDKVVLSTHFWLSTEEARELGQDESDWASPATRYMGRIGVNGAVFNRHVGPNTELLITARTEEERIEAMKRFCGFEIPVEDLEHIRGTIAALSNA